MGRREFAKDVRRAARDRANGHCEGTALLQRLQQFIRYEPDTGYFICISPRARHRVGDRVGGKKSLSGYRWLHFGSKLYPESHLAWLFVHGAWPPAQIDHINGVRDDNRLANLRAVSAKENYRNKARMKNNSSGATGVYFFKRDANWKACIRQDGRNIHLGYFARFEDAVAARKAAERQYGYHENHGREAHK